jgi:hypothetical protein
LPKSPRDPSFPADEAVDLDKLIESRDTNEQIEQLKGDLPCLDSSASCILQLQALAIKSNSQLKQLSLQIDAADASVKAAAKGDGNIFRQAQFLKPLIGTAFLGPAGGLVGLIDVLAGNSRTDQATAQTNADLQIKVAQIQRTKVEVTENLKLQVINELIKFDEVRSSAELDTAIALRETSRLRLLEIAYRLGEGTTGEYISLQNNADRSKAGASAKRSAMRSQAEKIKRIVQSGEVD